MYLGYLNWEKSPKIKSIATKLLDVLYLFVPITVLPVISHAEPQGFRYKDSSTLPVYLIQCIIYLLSAVIRTWLMVGHMCGSWQKYHFGFSRYIGYTKSICTGAGVVPCPKFIHCKFQGFGYRKRNSVTSFYSVPGVDITIWIPIINWIVTQENNLFSCAFRWCWGLNIRFTGWAIWKYFITIIKWKAYSM